MSLIFADGTTFTTGTCRCASRPATEGERLPRLFVPIRIEGFGSELFTEAVVDTGGAYLILGPVVAAGLGLESSSGVGHDSLSVRGLNYPGFLHRVNVEFIADMGTAIQVEVTAFIPEMGPDEHWLLPVYLGWHSCLERVRFAVDPLVEQFYFGPSE